MYTDPGCYKGENAITEALNDFDNSNQMNYIICRSMCVVHYTSSLQVSELVAHTKVMQD